MYLQRFYKLLLTQLRVSTRNRSALFFTLVFPLVFVGVFGIAFQEGDPANTTIPIAVVNQDMGIPDNAMVYGFDGERLVEQDLSLSFLDVLSDITFEDNKTNILELVMYDDIDKAERKVSRQSEKGLLVIPEDFSIGFMAAIRFAAGNESHSWMGYPSTDFQSEIQLSGDNALIQYNIVVSVVRAVVEQYFKIDNTESNVVLELGSTIDSQGFTTFDYVVPGLVIFAIISNANTVAAVALNDVESQMLDRLRLTKLKKWEYPASLVLSQIIVSFVQLPILFGTALIFGFPFTNQLALAFIFALFVSIAMTGIGMILAGLFTNAESVGGLASIITTPMAFFAGAFFTMPNPEILPAGLLGESPFGLFDILPPTRAITSLRLVLFNGYGLADIYYDLLIAATLAILYLTVGIFIYSRKHLRTH